MPITQTHWYLFPLIKLAKKLKAMFLGQPIAQIAAQFPLIKLAKKLKAAIYDYDSNGLFFVSIN